MYAALKRANKPKTVSIVLILTVCSSHLCTCVNTTSHGSSATPGSAIGRVYCVRVIHTYINGWSRRRTTSRSSDGVLTNEILSIKSGVLNAWEFICFIAEVK